MQTSKSLAVAQYAIPLFPFADETKIREHAISSSHLRSFRTPISFLFCAFIVTLAVLFPGVRVPPAATRRGTRPGRNPDRHVRCESQALADGFRPGLARSCLFLQKCPTGDGLAACSEY